MRYLRAFFASAGELSEMGHQMLLTEFYPDRRLFPKKTKWAIPRLIQQISPRSLKKALDYVSDYQLKSACMHSPI